MISTLVSVISKYKAQDRTEERAGLSALTGWGLLWPLRMGAHTFPGGCGWVHHRVQDSSVFTGPSYRLLTSPRRYLRTNLNLRKTWAQQLTLSRMLHSIPGRTALGSSPAPLTNLHWQCSSGFLGSRREGS